MDLLKRKKKKATPKPKRRRVKAHVTPRRARTHRPKRPPGRAPAAPAFDAAVPVSSGAGDPGASPPIGPQPTVSPTAPPDPQPTDQGLPVYRGQFGPLQAERLLWRAGFGPTPGQTVQLAAGGLEAAVRALTRPAGDGVLLGAPPRTQTGDPLAPRDLAGHAHLWWLDRMVRSDQPLVERMALIWHDWFATVDSEVAQDQLMLDQNELFRRAALGSFAELAVDVARDPAMLVFLNGIQNREGGANENFARELMELFTLGADRGAYTEEDVREAARALTGWRADYVSGVGAANFRYDPTRHDAGAKTIFGRTGLWDWQDAVRLCLENPHHPSFFVQKLWACFVADAPDPDTRAGLEKLYVESGLQVRPVVEAILRHPALYEGSAMVKPPVVYCAGLLRALGRTIDTEAWTARCQAAGQRLFHPPSVAGWNDGAWLDTSSVYHRWLMVGEAVSDRFIRDDPGYDRTETADQAVAAALAFWADPPLRPETRDSLIGFAASCIPAAAGGPTQSVLRGQRQNALRHLIAGSADLQIC